MGKKELLKKFVNWIHANYVKQNGKTSSYTAMLFIHISLTSKKAGIFE